MGRAVADSHRMAGECLPCMVDIPVEGTNEVHLALCSLKRLGVHSDATRRAPFVRDFVELRQIGTIVKSRESCRRSPGDFGYEERTVGLVSVPNPLNPFVPVGRRPLRRSHG